MEAATVELDGQYRALREEAGSCGRETAAIRATGPDAVDYLQGQLTQDVEAIPPGGGAYSALLDRKGHMQGDMRVLALGDEELLLLCEPVALDAILGHLSMYKVGREVEVADATTDTRLVSVIGPAAAELVLGGPAGAEHEHREHEVGGARCRVVATDAGLDLVVSAGDEASAAAALASAGVAPVSEAAAEIVRVEAGRPRFGHEMTTETIPQEAGINERAVSFTKGCYIGQETVARLHYKGKPNRHLRGLALEAPATRGDPVMAGEKALGTIGTAVISPARGPIALAILRREAEPGARVTVANGNGAEVVELPFVGA